MLRIGIIGSGFGLYGHLPAFSQIQNCRVVCICGDKTSRLVSYCNSIGLKNIYTDWQEMLNNEDLDAITLAVPPNIQYKIAKFAASKSLHIFAEKPLAINLKQAKHLLELAGKNKIVTAVDFIFPEIEEWQAVKKILEGKRFGQLQNISVAWDFLSYDIKNKISSWKTNPKQGGGALSFYFSHSLYYLEYFAGEILSAKSQLAYSKESKNGGEVAVDLLLKFKHGVTGQAHLCSNSRVSTQHQLVFTCEHATILLENTGSHVGNFFVKIFTSGQVRQLAIKHPETRSKKNEDERVKYVKKIASRFVDCCISNRQATPSFKDAVRVQELVEKIRLEQA